MRSLFALMIFLVLLCSIFISCEKESMSSNQGDKNNPPEIAEFLYSPELPLDLSIQDRIEIQAVAVDADDDDLTYFWECTGEIDSPIGAPDNLIVMQATVTGFYELRCNVSDGKVTIVDTVLIEVVDENNALPESNITFSEHIRPLFRIRCGSENGCHSFLNTGGYPAKRLQLTNYQSTITHLIDGDEPLIIPGQGEQSFLYKILFMPLSDSPRMPKERIPLNTNNTNCIRIWIDEGALE
jgi:hypothetical protein